MKYIVNVYRKNEYIKYSLWFGICIAIILFPFAMHGKSLIQVGDGFNIFFPLFVYIGQWIRACLHGDITLFDFRLGLGDDVLHALNGNGFGDITQILSAVVPYEYTEYAYNFVMILKLWLCGISFLVYIKRYVHKKEYRIVGALLYACNTYTLVWGFNFWTFLVPMMTFPLILSGIDSVCNGSKKISAALLAGIWIQSLSGFYFLYMEVLLTVLYFLVKEFDILYNMTLGRWKKLLCDGGRILFQSLLAVGLGAPLLLPSVVGYFQSSRSGNREISFNLHELFIYPFDFYQSMLSHLLIPNIYRNIFTLGYIVIIGSIVAFIHKSGKYKVHRHLFMLFFVLYSTPLWGRIMNGFSYSSDRWLFGFMLVAITLAMVGMDTEVQLSKKEMAGFYLLIGILLALYLIDSDWYSGKILVTLAYGIVGIILPFVYSKRLKYSQLILPICAFLIIMNGLCIFLPREIGGSGYVYGFKGKGAAKMEVDEQIDVIEDSGEAFERKDVYSTTSLGASLIKNFYGTTEYFSTLNGNSSEFYKELRISPGLFGATWVLKGLDGRTELEALCSVRQVMEYAENDSGYVYKYNEAYLPLGITYQSWISREQFERLNPMEKESALIRYAVLENEESGVAKSVLEADGLEEDIFEANKEVAYTLSLQNVLQNSKGIYAEENATIRVYLNDFYEWDGNNGEQELYVQLQDLRLLDEGTADVWVGNKIIQLRNAADDYYMGIDEFWINVTEWKYDKEGYYFDIKLPEGKQYSLEDIKVYRHRINYIAIEERKENSLEKLELGTNRISGMVHLEEPSLMLFTIPYSQGWKAYVDGVQQPVYKADVGFLAIELSEGSHTIVLKYMTQGLIPGCICSIICAVILIIICYKKCKKK